MMMARKFPTRYFLALSIYLIIKLIYLINTKEIGIYHFDRANSVADLNDYNITVVNLALIVSPLSFECNSHSAIFLWNLTGDNEHTLEANAEWFNEYTLTFAKYIRQGNS